MLQRYIWGVLRNLNWERHLQVNVSHSGVNVMKSSSRLSGWTGFRKLSDKMFIVLLLLLYLSGDLSQHQQSLNDKYFHFYSVCFGLGCAMALYRPFHSVLVPSVLGVFFTMVFEVLGITLDLPAHTKRCKGPPYDKRDVYWGFCLALFVAYLNLHSYHVYTLSYGCGIIMFALRGAKRKYSFLRKLRQKQGAWRKHTFTSSFKRGRV